MQTPRKTPRRARLVFASAVVAALGLLALALPAGANSDRLLVWSFSGRPPLPHCVRFVEPAEPPQHTWGDNFLCSRTNFGMRWSYAGPLPGMRCTQILEAADPHTWADNFLCVPPTAPIHFQWSSAGPVPGRRCVQINEPKEEKRSTWHDNFLCY